MADEANPLTGSFPMKFDVKKLNPMALKDVDWKQFFIEKGERVGLGVSAFLMVVITGVSLFMPNHGFLLPGPSNNAKELSEVADRVTQNQNSAMPTTDDLPGNADTTVKFESDPILNTSEYQVVREFWPPPAGITKRRPPDLLQPDEGTADVAFVQARAYIYSKLDDNPHGFIEVLEGASGGNTPGAAATSRTNNAPPSGLLRGLSQQGRTGGGGGPIGNVGAGNQPAPGGGPIGGGGGFGARPGGGPIGAGGGGAIISGGGGPIGGGGGRQTTSLRPGQTGAGPAGAAGGRTALSPRFVKVSEITEDTPFHYAERVLPMRVGIVCATFPYRKQVEEFQRKLRLDSPLDVLNETSEEEDDGQKLPSFRFLGVEAQRRVLAADGKPLENWQPLDLAGSLKPYIIENGTRFEKDPDDLKPLIVDGLWMPLLLQFDENKFNRYPEIEKRLVNVRKTLDDLKTKAPEDIIAVRNPLVDKDDFDPFNATRKQQNANVSPRGPASAAPPPGAANQAQRYSRRGADGRIAARQPGANPAEQRAEDNAAAVLPEHVLVRIVDVDIDPGKIYEYRLHVRMANPNYKRYADVLSLSYASDKELHAEKDRKDSDWFVVPKKVSVPPEFYYYAVDQKEIDGSSFSGIHARDSVISDHQTVFQIHRWLEDASRSEKDPQWVGEWTVAERVIVSKGEHIGRTETVHVPIWRSPLEAFVLMVAEQPQGGSRKKDTGVEVDFSLPNDDAVLVDFEGGPQHFKRSVRHDDRVDTIKTDERITQEVLLVSSDGRVTARNGANDAFNADRVNRLDNWRRRILEIRYSGQGTQPGGPASPFAPGGRPGGGAPGSPRPGLGGRGPRGG
jgi:hypothetical protein